MNVIPAMVRVPERADVVVFEATENVTVCEPVPDAPLVMLIQVAWLAAVQVAVAGVAVTLTLPVPPEAGKLAEVALSENTGCPAGGVMVTASGAFSDRPFPEAMMVALYVPAARVDVAFSVSMTEPEPGADMVLEGELV